MPRSRPAIDPRATGLLTACLLVSAWALGGCAGAPTPILEPLLQMPTKTPVIYVPGSTGTELRHRETKKIVWGRGRQLLLPRDGGYAIARPIRFSPSSSQSRLEAGPAIEKISLAGIFHQQVYGPIVRLLEANGYRRGDLEAPAPDDTAFLFAYDWRLDHRLAAARLLDRLEGLRRARGEERLEVDLVCQSNGAYICRYLVKYGGATIEDAAAGRARPPERISVRKLILMGNSNGGSLRMLREMHRGRSYVDVVGRKMLPEVLFTVPAFYQDLPVVRRDLFLGEDGEALDVDLFDPESWRRYGWSAFDPVVAKRLARKRAARLFGDEEARLEFLSRALEAARRLHEVLARDAEGFGDPHYYLVQSRSQKTPDRAVLIPNGDGWTTLFTGDKKLERLAKLDALASADGDGHGTVESQMWLSPQEKAAIAVPPAYVDDEHFELILEPETHRRLLEFLLDDPPAAGE